MSRPLLAVIWVLVLAGTLAVVVGITAKPWAFVGLALLVVGLGTLTFALLKYR